jgi:hypothetical protein
MLDFQKFAENFVYLQGRRISFEGRRYLPAIYEAASRGNLVLRCSRQVEKSTLLANLITYLAVQFPGMQMLFVCPREEQALTFSRDRLAPTVLRSPLIKRLLSPQSARMPAKNITFANQSQVHIRSAFHSADACRGLSADVLLIDEYQDIAGGYLPVLEETLSHAKRRRTILTGTPKMVDNHLETAYGRSTAGEWRIPCHGCRETVRPDDRILTSEGLRCHRCGAPVDPREGEWSVGNPNSAWGAGFWVNHLMVPWLSTDDVLTRQSLYNPVQFLNECLGLPTALGDHVITRAEIEACCQTTPMARTPADIPRACGPLFAGIDWGGGAKSATVLTLGQITADKVFHVRYLERFRPQEDPAVILQQLAERCHRFGVQWIAADGGGNGYTYNRLLQGQLSTTPIYAVFYGGTDQRPTQDGVLWKWTIDRSASIGALFTRIKKQLLRFPRVEECSRFLDEFTCVLADFDDHQRTITYIHPEDQLDDALHATNYAQSLALYAWAKMYGG